MRFHVSFDKFEDNLCADSWVPSGQMLHQFLNGRFITFQALAYDAVNAKRFHIGMVAKGFPLVYIRDMNLHTGQTDGGQAIPDGNGGMGEGGGIKNQAIRMAKPYGLELVQDGAFMIGLKVTHFHLGKGGLQFFKILLKTAVPVYFRFPPPEQVQIGAVNDPD